MLHGNRYTAHCIVSLPIYTLGDVTEVVENLCKLVATLAIWDSVSPNPPPTDLSLRIYTAYPSAPAGLVGEDGFFVKVLATWVW